MDQKQLMAFVQWLPTKVKELQNKSPEEIVGMLNELSKTPEGQQQIEGLVNQFKQESAGMFKQGGKLNSFVEKFGNGGKKVSYWAGGASGEQTTKAQTPTADTPYGQVSQNSNGNWVDVDGRNVNYRESPLSEWLERRRLKKQELADSNNTTVVHDPTGQHVYSRTILPFSQDTIVSRDNKVYESGFFNALRRKFFGPTEYDRINRSIDSLLTENAKSVEAKRIGGPVVDNMVKAVGMTIKPKK